MLDALNEFEDNRRYISKKPEYIRLDETLVELRDFLNEFCYLTFGRDTYVFRAVGPVYSGVVLGSATRTMESIRYCCMNANFADAYTLLRKYRDDLFYYIYLSVVADKVDITQWVGINELKPDEKNIWDWVHNRQQDLHIGEVLKTIAMHPSANEAVKRFGLQTSFNKLRDKLNDYVHSNGYRFYNEPCVRMDARKKIANTCAEIEEIAVYITVVFGFLIALVNPVLIMSYEYMDYLDAGEEPPEESKYMVAMFVSDFFAKHKAVLDEQCVDYLRESTMMQI